jgi:hypothetical protein
MAISRHSDASIAELSEDLLVNPSSLPQPVTDIRQSSAGGPATKKRGRRNSAKRSLQLAKRRIFEHVICCVEKVPVAVRRLPMRVNLRG